ncbi:MAG: nuoF 1 [Actinobacteria bacterium]|nr:nuoF 1 [Actinomycetota bacterium]
MLRASSPGGVAPRDPLSPGFLLGERPVASLEEYRALGGWRGLDKARSMAPAAVIAEISASGLRGRGGAGFPTGTKWASVREGGGRHHYAVCNGAEGEPATFKDRALMRANPYQVIEGLLIAAHAVEAIEAYLAIKASFTPERDALTRALAEIGAEGLTDDVPVFLVTGPEEYLFGEEKALLEVIEGNDPLPRWLPPYLHGLFVTDPQLGWAAHENEPGHDEGHEANPTLVNNVETLANVPHILAKGSAWFRTMGTAASPGTVVCTVVGDIAVPQVLEVELGTPLQEVLESCGGSLPGRSFQAVLSGVSNPVLTADQLSTPLSYEGMEAAGTGLGAAGFAVYDDTACMVELARSVSRFLYVESCGQCVPCKFGTGEITEALDRLRSGRGTNEDLDRIQSRLTIVTDGNRCFLPVEERRVIASLLLAFPEDFALHLEGPCPRPRELPIPKIVDLEDGKVVYDLKQATKLPDWTYAEG